MKKSDVNNQIRIRAFELAETGNYSDFWQIERKLVNEGYTKARRVLDVQFLRKELDEICQIAQSPQAVKDRELFKNWLDVFVRKNIDNVKKKYPYINISIGPDYFIFSTHSIKMKYQKELDGKRLSLTETRMEIDGNWYGGMSNIINKTFEDFSLEDLLSSADRCDSWLK